MRRFIVKPEQLLDASLELRDEEFHHLVHVCRLEVGERVELLDRKGKMALGEITAIGKKAASISVLKVWTPEQDTHVQIHLYLALPKFQTMDDVVEKCSEMGVISITPCLSDRSFLKKKSPELEKKVLRWQKLADQSSKQCGRAQPLEIREPKRLLECFDVFKNEKTLFLYEGETPRSLAQALPQMESEKSLNLVIGPEGGFSVDEVKNFSESNIQPVTLGTLVLRVETACIAAVSSIEYHFSLARLKS